VGELRLGHGRPIKMGQYLIVKGFVGCFRVK